MKQNEKMTVVTQLVMLLMIGSCHRTTEALYVGISQGSDFPPIDQPSQHRLQDEIEQRSTFLIKEIDNNPQGNGDIEKLAKQFLNSISQHTAYAHSEDDLKDWKEKEDVSHLDPRQMKMKRAQSNEQHVGGCDAKIAWLELTPNHYPRYIKSYNCTSTTCDRTFGQCRGKSYPVKVLKRNIVQESGVSGGVDEGCDGDQQLPLDLRCNWKLETVQVTTYCECISAALALLGR